MWFSNRPATDFTDPSKFQMTQLRTTTQGAEKQRAKGIEMAKDYTVHIAVNDTWSANRRNESISSYEKIGYHADTAALLQGFIDSGCTFFIHRWNETLGVPDRYAATGTECVKL